LAPLFQLKGWLMHQLADNIPAPASGLIAGMLLGDKTSIPLEWLDAFKVTGLSHIVAVSGYNVSILIGVLASSYRWLGRRRLLPPLLILLIAFALITGGGSSVWRAALMAIILLVGQRLGRQYDARTALWLSAAVLAFINPLVVIADVGFQLSVLATAGIIYGVSLVQFFASDRYRDNPLLLSAAVSFCSIVATLPVIMFQFGQVSSLALPVNIVVVPLVPVLMLLGTLSLLPLIGGGAGLVVGFLVRLLMQGLLWVARWPFAQRQYNLSLMELAAALIVLIVFAWLGNRCWQLSRRVNL
jgi:competence protein ComEC